MEGPGTQPAVAPPAVPAQLDAGGQMLPAAGAAGQEQMGCQKRHMARLASHPGISITARPEGAPAPQLGRGRDSSLRDQDGAGGADTAHRAPWNCQVLTEAPWTRALL